jgi:uncharacterized membrane protein YhaH (DUF805 family)
MSIATLPIAILDPRGRCNRKGLLIAALGLFLIQVAGAIVLWLRPELLEHPVTIVSKVVLLVAAITAATQRLHDTGRSGWWMLWSFLGLFAWGLAFGWGLMYWLPVQAMQPGGHGFAALTAAIAVPAFAMLMWLHCAPGDTCANRYGAVPDGLGFARRERRAPQSLEATAAA